VPLPDALAAQATTAAAAIEAQVGRLLDGAPPATSTGGIPGAAGGSVAGSTGAPSAAAGPGATATSSGGGAPAPLAGAPPQPAGASVPKAPSVAQQPVAGVRRTPSLPGPAWLGALLVITLIGGGLAATSPPVLHLIRTSSPVLHLLGAAIRLRARKGVLPTER